MIINITRWGGLLIQLAKPLLFLGYSYSQLVYQHHIFLFLRNHALPNLVVLLIRIDRYLKEVVVGGGFPILGWVYDICFFVEWWII